MLTLRDDHVLPFLVERIISKLSHLNTEADGTRLPIGGVKLHSITSDTIIIHDLGLDCKRYGCKNSVQMQKNPVFA